MKINNLKINGFGKIENKEIKLSDNINLIYGENEAGKTTLLKFISGMFYGISKNKNKKEIPDYEKYKPWKAEEYSGKIEYVLDNKETFEVFRDFNKKNPKIYKNSEDISKNFNIDKTRGNEFFYEQTNIDEQTFSSTTLIEQKEVVLDNSEQNILTQKIANLLLTGEENVSYKKTKDLLNKKQNEEVGSSRTVGRPLNVITEKIEKLMKEKESLAISDEKKEEIEIRQKNTKDKINEKEIKINLIKKINSKKIEENIEEEKIKINNEIINNEKININHLKSNIKDNKIKINKKNNKINIIILILLLIINLILFILRANKIINILLLVVTLAISGIIIIKKIKTNKKINLKKIEENKYLLEKETAENNIKTIEEKINKINLEKIQKNELEKNQIKNEFKNKIDENEIDYLLSENKITINNILESLEGELSSLKIQLHTSEIDYNNILKKLEEKAKIEENLQGALYNKKEILKLEKEINIARTALERAYDKMKKEITPKFTKSLSTIVDRVSDGKYNKINFIDGEGLIVELENGEYVNANKLSIGTIDQLYLSLRLSAMQEITKEKMPIILDETFAYYDNQRLENILTYIDEELKENQVIIFTCSNREKEILEKNNIKFNYINI